VRPFLLSSFNTVKLWTVRHHGDHWALGMTLPRSLSRISPKRHTLSAEKLEVFNLFATCFNYLKQQKELSQLINLNMETKWNKVLRLEETLASHTTLRDHSSGKGREQNGLPGVRDFCPFFFAIFLECLKWGCQSSTFSSAFQLRGRNMWCPKLESLWRSHKSLETCGRLVHFKVRVGFTRRNHKQRQRDKRDNARPKSPKS